MQDPRRNRMQLLRRKNQQRHHSQGLEAEDAASGRAATELAPVDVHFSSTVRAPGVLLPVVQAMSYGENGKKRLVNCLLNSASEKPLIRTDVADELELSRIPSAVTVRGVHGLSARVADSRHVRFQDGCGHEIGIDSALIEREIDLPRAATLATPPCLTSIHVLIRFNMYYRVLGRGLRVAGEDDLIAMETTVIRRAKVWHEVTLSRRANQFSIVVSVPLCVCVIALYSYSQLNKSVVSLHHFRVDPLRSVGAMSAGKKGLPWSRR
ncbi:hypothetical protein Tsp_04506 [Trichinella spiralis]|uniref:hypothetical protein n=1 Tax=Trichinella spiralis TaxID=6334 RepID=UPI0001EFEEC8|nr:hypothetical protein Tsp_04506 [Trichinella spiralis]